MHRASRISMRPLMGGDEHEVACGHPDFGPVSAPLEDAKERRPYEREDGDEASEVIWVSMRRYAADTGRVVTPVRFIELGKTRPH